MIPAGKTDSAPFVPPEWQGAKTHFPRTLSVVDLFSRQAIRQPDAPAIQVGKQIINFGELDRRSNAVAGELIRHGLQPDEPVVTVAKLSVDYLIGILGILKAGGCYFPIDADTPARRLEFLLGDCKARFVLADASCRGNLSNWSGTVLDLSELAQMPCPDAFRPVPSDPQRAAYLLYTSGSTGQPKGVQIEHHSLTNFILYYHRYFGLSPQSRGSTLAYISFDVSVSDIWPVLCAGGTVVISPPEILTSPNELIHWLEREQISFSFIPTGLAEILFTLPWPNQMPLRHLVTGGDRLRVRPPEGLPFTVINAYGPTECTVWATLSVVTPEDGNHAPPPIGRPIDNVTAYVLDEHLRPLPVGEAGELYLGGEQVARGYLDRPELTRERFLHDPFFAEPGARMYRTGDWARWLPSGELDFLGRRDDQFQIRGRRVELGEIEAPLFAHPEVRQVCCVPQVVDGVPTGVIAHVVPKSKIENIETILRRYCQEELPDYMVPTQFVLHEQLPLTPQGKADRAALKKLALNKPADAVDSTPVTDATEAALWRLWCSLLPAAVEAGKSTPFAVLGGDSLLAVRLALGVEEIIGLSFEASAFQVQPTFSGLCQAVRERQARGDFQPALMLRKEGSRPPLFFLYGHSGDIEVYFGLTEAMGEDQPIIGIRSPALRDNKKFPTSLEAAATEAIQFIRAVQPTGAPALVGYSWAGLLAFEIARQLREREKLECFTVMIGSEAPMRDTTFVSRTLHFLRYFPGWLLHLLGDTQHRWRRLARWKQMAKDTTQNIAEARLEMPDWVTSPVSRHLINLLEQYRPLPPADISVTIMREREEYTARPHPLRAWFTSHLHDGGWNHWTRRANDIHWLDGDHGTVLRPPLVAGLARKIREAHDKFMERS